MVKESIMNKYERYKNGVLVESIAYTEAELVEIATKNILAEVTRLESQITPRRIREAVLGTDNGWLEAQEALIAIERAKL